MKKLFALLLTVVMVMSMAVTAFADDEQPADPEPTVSASPAEGDTESEDLYNRTFVAYQIFKATNISAEGELGNLDWGSGITNDGKAALIAKLLPDWDTTEKGTPSAADVAAAITEDYAKEVAQLTYNYLQGDGIPVVSEETTLNIGYYLIVDKTTGELTPNVYNLSILKVSDNKTPVKVVSKVSVPTVDKKILIERGDTFEKANVNEANIGDEITYEIVGTLPSNLADYESYYYQFTDTMSKGLTYVGNLEITVVNKNADGTTTQNLVTDKFTAEVSEYDAAAGTIIKLYVMDIKDAEAMGVAVTKDSKVVVTYKAKLNANAVIASTGNPNEVDLTYSNNPDNSGKGEPGDVPGPNHPVGTTPKKDVVTFTTELKIIKTDDKNQILPGVEFTLSGNGVNVVLVTEERFTADDNGEYWLLANGTYTKTAPVTAADATNNEEDYASTTQKYKLETVVTEKTAAAAEEGKDKAVVGTVLQDGTVTFTGLGAGSYTITETKTLPGYNTIEPISFVIKCTTNEESKTAVFTAYDKADAEEVSTVILLNTKKASTLQTTIVNKKGVTLPETGGIGTTIFYVAGAAMVVLAGILLIVKKRTQNND